jgi:predicted Zn-dependent peptidase
MEYQVHTLDNGIRLVHKPVKGIVAHCGLMVNTGSRDELEKEQGMAHFIEHVIFKGTKKRKAYHILCRLEDVGGDLNAYTAKEETCIYASFLNEYYDRTLELFSDIAFNSVFPAKELNKEKEVILDEINSYLDSPSEQIFDDFEELVYKDHPIGRNILGTPAIIKKFRQSDVKQFIANNYFTSEMVVCSVGEISFKKLITSFEKYFNQVPRKDRNKDRQAFNTYIPNTLEIKKDTYQTHCNIGNVAYSIQNNKRVGLFLLNNILGGPGMNSRLNMSLREKYGYAYNIESHYTPYSDTGMVNIYFGTDNGYLPKSLAIINREIKLLQTKRLGTLQLSKAKKQLTGQLAISNENMVSQMLSMGKSFLVFDKCESMEEVNAKIEAIKASEILEIANEVYSLDQLSKLVFY